MNRADRKLICFDLGGVIVRICRSWEEGCAAADVDADRDWTPSMTGGEHHRLVLEYSTGRIDSDAFFQKLEALAGGVYTAPEFRRIHDAWIIGEYAGVHTLLSELCDQGAALACLSNTNAAHWEVMASWPALQCLHHQHASHLIGHAKPNREIYDWFVRERRVSPSDIVFFDDLPDNIAAAQALGWDAVQIDHQADTAAQIRAALTDRSLL